VRDQFGRRRFQVVCRRGAHALLPSRFARAMVRSWKPDRIPEIRSYSKSRQCDALGPRGAPRLRISRIRTRSASATITSHSGGGMMAATTVESNIALVRDYTLRVFNEHNPALAAEFVTPDVKWHGGTLGSIEGSDNLIALLSSFIGALPVLNA